MKEILSATWNLIKINFPSIIALIGIIASYFSIKKSYKNDLNKMKAEKIYDKIEELPFEILTVMHDVLNKKSDKNANVESLSKFMYKVIGYGSSDAVKIAPCIQKTAYLGNKPFKLLAAYSLLVTQLKYDLSGQLISPESYFEIKLKDYSTHRDEIIMYINEIVNELNLNKKYKIE